VLLLSLESQWLRNIEYPGADDRGGRPEDTANFVLLCKEIKAAFSGYYGTS